MCLSPPSYVVNEANFRLRGRGAALVSRPSINLDPDAVPNMLTDDDRGGDEEKAGVLFVKATPQWTYITVVLPFPVIS